MSGNGNGKSTLDPSRIVVSEMPEDVLCKMNHREWLQQFAGVLEITPRDSGVPMTPFRAGAVNRLKLASRYVGVLERDLFECAAKLKEAVARIHDLSDDIQHMTSSPKDAPDGR